MRARLKNSVTMEIGNQARAENLCFEPGKRRLLGIETGPMALDRSGWQFHDKNCFVWSPFTPCTPPGSLLEAVEVSEKNAVPGDVILPSPARSNFNWFRIYQNSDVFLSSAVSALATATGSGVAGEDPNRQADETV